MVSLANIGSDRFGNHALLSDQPLAISPTNLCTSIEIQALCSKFMDLGIYPFGVTVGASEIVGHQPEWPIKSSVVKRIERINENSVPEGYMCHLCFTNTHFIRDCPLARPRIDGKTPYQGKKRCFGEYQCPKCMRKWMSGNSWANFSQDCIRCKVKVYPHKQRPLDQPDGLNVSDQTKEHLQALCEKCKGLGSYCRKRI